MNDPLFEAILVGNVNKAQELTRQHLDAGIKPFDVINDYLIPAMTEIGRRFDCNEYFVPELLISARACKVCLNVLMAEMEDPNGCSKVRVVIGAVEGELHDIGIVLIGRILECTGVSVVNLGVDVSVARFVEAVRVEDADILALSASNVDVKTQLGKIIEQLEAAGMRNKVKVMVGGPLITQGDADECGADGYSDSAVGALELVQGWMGD